MTPVRSFKIMPYVNTRSIIPVVDEIYPSGLTASVKVVTVLGSTPASSESDTVEFVWRQMKQYWINYKVRYYKIQKVPIYISAQ